MSGLTNNDPVLDRIDKELADKNENVKNILHEVYESQAAFLIEQKQHDKSKRLADLFNRLIDLLDDVLYSRPSSVDDTQIDSMLDKIKTDLNRWRLKWSTSALDVSHFEEPFNGLVQAIEGGFCIISSMFNDLKKKVENLTLAEQTRTKKEKLLEKQILIRGLLILGRDRLHDEYDNRQLPGDKFGIYYNKRIDIKKLENKYPLMYDVLNNVAKEFDIDSDQFLLLLREKRKGHDSVHVYRDIQHYARAHKIKQDFDLNRFLKQQAMHEIDDEDWLVLQRIFSTAYQPPFSTLDLTFSSSNAVIAHSGQQISIIKRDSSTAIYALDTHPFQHKLCLANASCRLQLWDYQEKVIITSLQRTQDNAVTQLRYNHNENFIAIGYANGQLTLCDALSLESIANVPFHYAKTAIIFIQFSPKSIYLATTEDDYTVSIYRQNLSADRTLAEYDLNESEIDQLVLKPSTRIEQIAETMSVCYYPSSLIKESFLVTTNNEYNPTFGSPLHKIDILPKLDKNSNEEYIHFMTTDKNRSSTFTINW
ncbi:unnamed protein product [Rotaria magnacalcarata]|uniref:Cilia- and flagella-associated protein 251 n=1 Tax=Rotaria magnacalcarata TaxID=392030 RepID=A0A820F1Y1_9BILA|nr:unnamed protein product [Rotaria magnacalcarata]